MPTDKPDIRIFVSRRIDIDSVAVDNPLYIPVRCGAVFDENRHSPYAGDDTGMNISEKRMTFCEFTVQYWAWKNQSADYYGLCHYRRYLSFADRQFRTGAHGLVVCPLLDRQSMQHFGLLDEENIRAIIRQYDLIYPRGTPVHKVFTPKGKAHTVRDLWNAHIGYFFEDGIVDRMFVLIDELAPEYSISAREYFAGGTHLGYNCYIMRKELFDRLCRLQFPIMEALAKELDSSGSLEKFSRAPAYVGEMLFGVFLYHVTAHEGWRSYARQLVLFEETKPVPDRSAWLWYQARHTLDTAVWKSTLWLFPLGSRRREKCKKIYHRITRNNEMRNV